MMFFIRFLLPSDFLDLYDEVLLNSGSEEIIDNVLNKAIEYEKLIKSMYLILYKRRLLPDIEWLRKM
jgi:hypothetical protein